MCRRWKVSCKKGSHCRLPFKVYAANFFFGGAAFFVECCAILDGCRLSSSRLSFLLCGGVDTASWLGKKVKVTFARNILVTGKDRLSANSVSFSFGRSATVKDLTSFSVRSLFSSPPA
jgi:hypothetical protein